MTENVSVLLHWNTDYAEIPRKELPKVVETSYEPMVAAIEDWRDGTICFNITGHTIEYLIKNNPELVDRIKSLVKDNTVEMLACGYSHPILPLLPRERIETQVKDHLNQIKKVFGKKPTGMWPPELAISPLTLAQFKKLGIEWATIDYEHFQLAQWFGNDFNPFERRNKTVTELLSNAYWSKGLKRIFAYLKAKRLLDKSCSEHIDPLQRVYVSDDETMKVYLSSVSWSQATQFGVGGFVPIYNDKTHLKKIIALEAKIVPLYATDIEFFGYREMGPTPAAPKSLITFLEQLRKQNIYTTSPTQIKDEDWADEPKNISAGSWAPDKSFRIWTESEDNREYWRRADEIYAKLRALNWAKDVMKKVEPLLRIMENSDPRGWAPIPERKHEAYSAMNKIFKILEKE